MADDDEHHRALQMLWFLLVAIGALAGGAAIAALLDWIHR